LADDGLAAQLAGHARALVLERYDVAAVRASVLHAIATAGTPAGQESLAV
jgi:hypothetical protein